MSEWGKYRTPVYDIFPINERAACLAAGRLLAPFMCGNYLPYESAKRFTQRENPAVFAQLVAAQKGFDTQRQTRGRHCMLGGLYAYGSLSLAARMRQGGCLPKISAQLARTVSFEIRGSCEGGNADIYQFEQREEGLFIPATVYLENVSKGARYAFTAGAHLVHKHFTTVREAEALRRLFAVPVR